MRQIQLIGPVDKRGIAYPLFKACDTMGKTLVVTDDANFRRFAEKYEPEFTLGRSDFIINGNFEESFIENITSKFSYYDFVILISTDYLIDNNDCTVYCHGLNQSVCTEFTLESLESIEYTEVIISDKKPKDVDKEVQFLSIEGKGMKYIWDCEENKMFKPCSNSDLAKLSAYLFTKVIGIDSVEEYAKILQKTEEY